MAGTGLAESIRQIAQFPTKTAANAGDLFLLQNGGLGGPYQTIAAANLVSTALAGVPDTFALGGSIDAVGDGDFGGKVTVKSYLEVDGYLTVAGNIASSAELDINGGARIGGGMQLGGGAYIADNLSVGTHLDVGGPVTAGALATYGTLQVDGTAVINQSLSVGGALAANGPFYMSGDGSFTGSLLAGGNIAAGGGLTTGCGARFGGNVCVTGSISANNNLEVGGVVSASAICAVQNISASGLNIDGALKVCGPARVVGTLNVDDNAHLNSNLVVGGKGFFQGSLDVSGNANIGGNVCIHGYAGFSGDIGIFGDVDIMGALDICGDVISGGQIWAKPPAHGAFDGEVVTASWVRHYVEDSEDGILRDVDRWIEQAVAEEKQHILHEVSEIYAPLQSPDFTGMPTGPTPPQHSNDGKLATTAFVMGEIEHHTAGVASFNTRTGHVQLHLTDIEGAGGAPLHAPHFTGHPEADHPSPGTDSHILATTHFVKDAIAESRDASVISFNKRVGHVELHINDIEEAGGAPIRNASFLGSIHAPTPEPESRDTHVATTAFVHHAFDELRQDEERGLDRLWDELRDHTVRSWNQRTGHVEFRASDLSAIGGAFLASPHFTGKPEAPTAPPQADDAQLATTHYVDRAIASNPGPPGIQGPQGDIGPPGQSWQILGTVPHERDLPASNNKIGDVWLVDDTGEGFVWDGHRWKAVGHIRGARGPQGEEGAQGPPGIRGFPTVRPSNPQPDEVWLNPATNTVEVYHGGQWHALGYLPLSGGGLSGGLTVRDFLNLSGGYIQFTTHWLMQADPNFFYVSRRSGAGADLGTPLRIAHATGTVECGGDFIAFSDNRRIVVGPVNSGRGNFGIGSNIFGAQMFGAGNVALGTDAMASMEFGDNNIAVGHQALMTATAGVSNIAIGSGALAWGALTNVMTGDASVAVGADALSSKEGANGAVGIGAGAGGWYTTARFTTSVGSAAASNQTGDANTALGHWALRGGTPLGTGANNVAVGAAALAYFGATQQTPPAMTNLVTSATNCTFLGAFARPSANNPSNQIVIGHNAVGSGNDTATIGTAATTLVVPGGVLMANLPTTPGAAGTLYRSGNQVMIS